MSEEKIKINWIRHSISCNNIRSLWEFITKYQKTGDPSIIPETISANIFLRKHLPTSVKKTEYIFCSELKRSIQTAILLFPSHFLNNKIKIIPGVNESSIGLGNKKQKPEFLKSQLNSWLEKCQQTKKIGPDIKNSNYQHIERMFDILEKNNHFETVTKNCEKEEIIIPLLKKYMSLLGVDTINIVSHSKYIRDFIIQSEGVEQYINYFSSKGKPYNNQIIQKKYTFLNDEIVKSSLKPYRIGCTYQKKGNHILCFHNDKSFRTTLKKKNSRKIRKTKNLFSKKHNKKQYSEYCDSNFNQF